MLTLKATKIQMLVATAICAQLTTVACANKPRQAEQTAAAADSRAAAVSGAQRYVTIDFSEGQTTLDDSDKLAIRNLTSQVDVDRVDEVLVLAWADREYPADGSKASSRDVKIADQRAANIKKYIQDDLAFNTDVDRHNMAERPGTLSRIFRSQDFRVKNTLESTGEMPVAATANEPIVMDRKASSALVLLKYE